MRIKKLLAIIIGCIFALFMLTSCWNPTPDSTSGSGTGTGNGNEESGPITLSVAQGTNVEKTYFNEVDAAFAYAENKIMQATVKTDVTLDVSEGSYSLSKTIVFDGDKINNRDYSFTMKGAGADKTVLTSEVAIDADDLDDYGDGQYAYQLPETSKINGVYPSVRDFYVDGRMITMAKSSSYTMAYDIVEDDERVIYLDAKIFEGMSSEDIKGAELWIENVWNILCVHLEGFEMSNTKSDKNGNILYAATVRESDWNVLTNAGSTGTNYYDTLEGNAYWVQNSTYFLTPENENTFVYDIENGVFYVQLSSSVDVESITLSYPVLNTLLSLQDVKNVKIDGVGFTGTTNTFVTDNHYVSGQAGSICTVTGEYFEGFLPYAAVFVEDVNGMEIKNCLFNQLGTDGVNFRGAVDKVSILDNSFTNIAGTAIRLAEIAGSSYDNAYDEKTHKCDIVINNNYINGTGVRYLSSPAIQIGHVKNLKLTHNTILNSAYSAISVGWGWRVISDEAINIYNAEIAYNYIEGFMERLADGGAIYVVGGNASFDWKGTFNDIHDNFCVVTEDTKTNNYTVIYLDGSSTNWAVENNVIRAIEDSSPKMHFINFQTVGGQQVFNCTANDNYVVGITDATLIFGNALAAGDDYGLSQSGNVAVANYQSLETQYASALTIISSSGCAGHNGVWTIK